MLRSHGCASLTLVIFSVLLNRIALGEMPSVRVADDKHGIVLSPSGKPFVPWGFNYDHDENGRLLEDYWEKEWPKVEEDFREMKHLGANVARVHLQTAKFITGPEKTNEANLDRLGLLVALAEKTGIYLDITGLACYRKKDVPKWYDDLDEEQRWAVQCRFWEALPEFERFLDESKKTASGWIGFYWGKTPEECRKANTIHDAIMLSWLEFFQKRAGEIQRQSR